METTKRQSNFELLRILAIFLVILFHVQQHGPEQQLLSSSGGYFNQPIIYLRLLILEFGSLFGPLGNGLFIIISGYFMNANLNINTGKVAKKLLLQLGFAVTVLVLANAVWIVFFKKEELSLGIAVLADFNQGWWFIGYYFLVIILAKVFLNRFTAKLTQSQFKSLLLTLLAVSQFQWTGKVLESVGFEFRILAVGVFFFLMGGYIAKYNPFENLKTYTLFLIIAAAYGIRFISAFNYVSGEIDGFIRSNSVGILNFPQSLQKRWNYEIAAVIIVISLFELFRRLKVPNNAVINFMGKSTLMVYIFHEHSFFLSFYANDNWLETLSTNVFLYCLKWFKWAVIAFAVGLAAYGLYTLLGKLLPRMRPWFVVQKPSE